MKLPEQIDASYLDICIEKCDAEMDETETPPHVPAGFERWEDDLKRHKRFGVLIHNDSEDPLHAPDWNIAQRSHVRDILSSGDSYGSVQALCENIYAKYLFSLPCYVEEGYSTSEHAQAVMNLGVELFPDLPIKPWIFNLSMLYHDIGKGYARKYPVQPFTWRVGLDQHDVTREEILKLHSYMGLVTFSESVAMENFVCQDLIGEYVIGHTDNLMQTILDLYKLTRDFGLTIDETRQLAKAYFLSDSGAYTTRGHYVSDTTGLPTRCTQNYDIIYKFDQPSEGPLKMVPHARTRMDDIDRVMDYLAETRQPIIDATANTYDPAKIISFGRTILTITL